MAITYLYVPCESVRELLIAAVLGRWIILSEDRERKKSKNLTVEEAGHMGGQKVKKLIEEGKEHEEE